MEQNLQVIFSGDGIYKINMRGKSFELILDDENKTYEFKGSIPKVVKASPKEFIEWLLPRLESTLKAGEYSQIH